MARSSPAGSSDLPPTQRIKLPAEMRRPALKALFAALAAEGDVARFVGGCVRDALIGRPIGDIDLAVTAPPERTLRLLEAAGIKAVPTGLAHGTITAIVEHKPVEITTLRVDVETYGRHAKVAFTGDWRADAARRDFTMNALYADPDGRIYDPVGGVADLRAGRVRFVGDPAQRIAEDGLRILRFFRFHAWYGKGAPCAAGLAACAAAAGMLGRLSGERIQHEMLKLLAAPDPLPALRAMQATGVLAAALPARASLRALPRLIAAEARYGTADPVRRLAALLPRDPAARLAVAERLRLSNKARDRLVGLAAPRPRIGAATGEKTLRRIVDAIGHQAAVDRALIAGHPAQARKAAALELPPFPLSGRDVHALGVERGPAVGAHLGAARAWWVRRDFRPGRTECLAALRRQVAAKTKA